MDNGFPNLRLEMTIGELPCHDCCVSAETRGQVILELFESQHDIPGVAVTDAGRLLGVISRARFMEQLVRPFGAEIFLHRAIKVLLSSIACEPLLLDSRLGVHVAARRALERPTDQVFEPVAMADERKAPSWRLLDVHTLLRAQSGLLQLANDTVERQRATAESANRAKSSFLANMSHEIRTPLTAILGFAENLLDPDLSDPERRSAATTIVRNGQHLLELINDILDLSKIEAGKLDVERLVCSPAGLIADVMSVMRVRADARRLPLKLVWQTPVPATIQTDPTRLRQILINLVGNAIKFTERGSVELRVALHNESLQPRLEFAVVDSGIGMTEGQRLKLFEPFTQADETMARRFGGTGLGLAISRRLVELLDGSIGVSSQLGVGTTFHFQISTGSLDGVRLVDNPDEATVEEDAHAHATVESIRGRILLAEDSPDNQLLISTFLRKSGGEVEIAENGEVAVRMAQQAVQDGRPFGVVLMDMQMPILDGYAATRTLRAGGYRGAIIALTANAMRGDEQQCFDAGCNDYATKPIVRRRLLAQIARQLDLKAEPETSRPTDFPAAPAPRDTSQRDLSPVGPPILDSSLALERCGDDAELVKDLCGILLEAAPAWFAEMDLAAPRRDYATLRRLAHTLKSAADNVGGVSLSLSAERLEGLARNELQSEIELAHRDVVAEWNRLVSLIQGVAGVPA
jgi:signal transduction histidine kinase/HPt (histidine-containing phosphotransfer) domain-containing protein